MPRKKTSGLKLKEPVRIRFKELNDGTKSIYLDIYRDGKRQYEFLKLYLLPGNNPNIKNRNAETLAAAEAIKSKRVLEMTNGKAGLPNTGLRSKMLLLDWMKEFHASQIRKGVRGQKVLISSIGALKQYAPKARMKDVTKEFCLGFIDFLRNDYQTRLGPALTPYGMIAYFGFLRTALNAAVREQVISENPINRIPLSDRIKKPESTRVYLTIDEVKMMIDTDCKKEIVKMAFLFSCYCGLRLSDVTNLKWKDLSKDGDQWRVCIVMRKTSNPLYLPLSNQALKWLPERGEAKDEDNVFNGMPTESNTVKFMKDWAKKAGIAKNVNFHTSRHTFATMLLTLGADIYTVSKLLGHTNVKTTQIYAKIVNKKKDDAVCLVDSIFD
ncbi:MAG: site-specific integrase [Muribaculaceae bacterium]|nr:site-specific integrase [Muribaculaceae bacterium]